MQHTPQVVNGGRLIAAPTIHRNVNRRAHAVRPYESRETELAGRSGTGPYEGDKTGKTGG